MWECESCGTQGIAGDLVRCPGCGADRALPANEPATPVNSGQEHESEPESGQGHGWAAGGPIVSGETVPTGAPVPLLTAPLPAWIGEHGPELPAPGVATPPADEAGSDG